MQISEEFFVEKSQPIADPEVVFKKRHLASGSVPRDREFGPTGLLTVEKAADGFDGLKLVVEVGLEVEFHAARLQAADGFKAVLLEDGRQVGLGHVAAQARLGKRKWHTESGYSKRSKVETTFHRYKAIVGSAMRARTLAAQRVEARIGCKILNTMTALGMPDSEMIG